MTISVNITIALYVGYLRSNRDRMFEIDIIWGQNYRKKIRRENIVQKACVAPYI